MADSNDLLVLLHASSNEDASAKHRNYLEKEHIDAGKTEDYKIGEFTAYGFQSRKAAKQLARQLGRDTPSVQDQVIELLKADETVQSVESNQEMHICHPPK